MKPENCETKSNKFALIGTQKTHKKTHTITVKKEHQHKT